VYTRWQWVKKSDVQKTQDRVSYYDRRLSVNILSRAFHYGAEPSRTRPTKVFVSLLFFFVYSIPPVLYWQMVWCALAIGQWTRIIKFRGSSLIGVCVEPVRYATAKIHPTYSTLSHTLVLVTMRMMIDAILI